jgi:hypothetical protein
MKSVEQKNLAPTRFSERLNNALDKVAGLCAKAVMTSSGESGCLRSTQICFSFCSRFAAVRHANDAARGMYRGDQLAGVNLQCITSKLVSADLIQQFVCVLLCARFPNLTLWVQEVELQERARSSSSSVLGAGAANAIV